MSLIKLQGNASGTGAFTIAAPNGNTDRTLTLPDATGTMYNQGNIVGTVSQSGGVPTGRVIETGSNANGEYVKYADGTMFCYFTTPSVTNPSATVFADVLRSWPATFISTPKAFVTQATQHGDLNAGAAAMTANFSPSGLSLTSTTYRVGYRVALAGGYGVSADVVAIGRWF
jgi:hypothetical protein